jgi:hypothetical protein
MGREYPMKSGELNVPLIYILTPIFLRFVALLYVAQVVFFAHPVYPTRNIIESKIRFFISIGIFVPSIIPTKSTFALSGLFL